jgi:hypothetical protein
VDAAVEHTGLEPFEHYANTPDALFEPWRLAPRGVASPLSHGLKLKNTLG